MSIGHNAISQIPVIDRQSETNSNFANKLRIS